MKWFDYSAPGSLEEAVGLLSSHPKALPLAGGTDLLSQLRSHRKETDLVVDIKHVPELNAIRYDPAQGLTLGAAVACYRIYGHPVIRQTYPALAEVASLIGGVQIQGRASLGGNLCNAAPSADSVPLLIALRATCLIAGPAGNRTIPVEDFCTAPGRNVLEPGEVLVAFQLPVPDPASGAFYLRFIPRNEMDIAVAGAGVAVTLEDGHFRSARVALASVAPTPILVSEAGEWLAGKPVEPENTNVAAELAKKAARPISDMRGTSEYRRHLCEVLTRRALETAIRRAKEARS